MKELDGCHILTSNTYDHSCKTNGLEPHPALVTCQIESTHRYEKNIISTCVYFLYLIRTFFFLET